MTISKHLDPKTNTEWVVSFSGRLGSPDVEGVVEIDRTAISGDGYEVRINFLSFCYNEIYLTGDISIDIERLNGDQDRLFSELLHTLKSILPRSVKNKMSALPLNLFIKNLSLSVRHNKNALWKHEVIEMIDKIIDKKVESLREKSVVRYSRSTPEWSNSIIDHELDVAHSLL